MQWRRKDSLEKLQVRQDSNPDLCTILAQRSNQLSWQAN